MATREESDYEKPEDELKTKKNHKEDNNHTDEDHDHDHDDGNLKKIEIIINGTSYGKFTFEADILLFDLLTRALEETKNTGQSIENYEMKDQDGTVLDLTKHLNEYLKIKQIWINPKASIGGEINEAYFD